MGGELGNVGEGWGGVRIETKISSERKSSTREGVQSSSNSNHRHPNLFRGKRAPQLVISTTSISNHRKILFSVI